MERIPPKRSLPLKLAAAFKLLLWWGAETAREWMVKPARPEIRQIRHELTLYPRGFWSWDDKNCTFMSVSLDDRKAWVRQQAGISEN